MIQNKTNTLIFIAIFLLYKKMLSRHKKVEMVLGTNFKVKRNPKDTTVRCKEKKKEKASILEHVQANIDIFQTLCK